MNASHADLSHQPRVPFADGLRGIAALLVVLAHIFGLFWLDRSAIAEMTRLPPLGSDFTTPSIAWLGAPPGISLGALGVAIFFLVSGFVIPFSVERYSREGFAVARFFRIVPTYVAGFLIGVVGLFCASQIVGQKFGYSLSEVARHVLPGLRQFLSAPSIDGVVWTLEIEIYFYIFCIGLAREIRSGSHSIFAAAGVLAACCVFHWLWIMYPVAEPLRWYVKPFAKQILIVAWAAPYIIFMLVGTVFNFWFRNKMSDVAAILISVSLIGLATATYWVVNDNPAAIVLTSYAAGLVIFLITYRLSGVIAENSTLRFLSSISYPLYVVHPLFAYSALNVLIRNGVDGTMATLLVAFGTVILAWALHVLVEKPSHKLGQEFARARRFSVRAHG